MGCRCRRPPRDHRSCGEETLAGLAREPTVRVQLGVLTGGSVVPRLCGRSAGGNRWHRSPSFRTFADAALISPLTVPWYGLQGVCVCVCLA